MNVLRLFVADQKLSRGTVLVAIGTLAWFGIATNALFDLWKLIPTSYLPWPVTRDGQSVILFLLPPISFLVWIVFFIYPKISRMVELSNQTMSLPGQDTVAPHKGLVLALSRPAAMNPDEIVDRIKETKAEDIASLFSLRSIGQLFKSIHYHDGTLKHVWPITTRESRDYRRCLEVFVKKFMPWVRICSDEQLCHLESTKTEQEMIESTKSKLSKIYSSDELNTLNLTPSDIIVDITGGTRAISTGLTFGALDSSIDIQYVEQQSYNVIPLAISPQIILDKVGHYLLELDARLNKAT